MNSILFLSIFIAIGIINFIIGILNSKNIENKTDFFLAGRSLGLFSVTIGLVATQLGGSLIIGTTSEAYRFGYYGILYVLGMSFGFLLLAGGFAAKLQKLNISTTAEIFETKYKSKNLKKIASVFFIISLFGLLLGQIIGSKALLIGLNIDNIYTFFIFWLIIVAYAFKGGLRAIIASNIFQVAFIFIIFMGIFLYNFIPSVNFFFESSAQLHKLDLFSSDGFDFARLVQIFIMPVLFSLIEQDLAQQFFAARTKKIAILGALIASLILLLFALSPIYLGMTAKILNLAVPTPDSAVIIILKKLSNELFFILGICGIIVAISSTASSLLCAASSHIAQDFDFSFVKTKNKLLIPKVATILTGISAVIIADRINTNILDVITESYKLSVSCLFVSIFFCFFKKNLNKNAAAASIIFGFVSYMIFKFASITFVPDGIAAIFFSLIGYFLGSIKSLRFI